MSDYQLYAWASLIVVGILVLLLVIEVSGSHSIVPQPVYPIQIGGCGGTRWGCCPDGATAKADYMGTNCMTPIQPIPPQRMVGGCAGTRWGCCRDGQSYKTGPFDTC